MTEPVLGFIGLGQIGAPMAKRWQDRDLWVFDVRPEACAPFVAAGAKQAASPAKVAENAELISIVVRDDAQVADVVVGPDGLITTAQPGTVIAIHSTIHPSTAVELARIAAEKGVHVVDAPISGGAMGAGSGRLAVMIGGDEQAVEICREPFGAFADLIVHAGPVGAGTRMKLARNMMHFVAYTAATEAQRLAEASGLDLVALGKVVRHSDAVTGGPGAIMHRDTAAPLADGDNWIPIFTHLRQLAEKDLQLAIELADQTGVEVPMARLALERIGPGLGL